MGNLKLNHEFKNYLDEIIHASCINIQQSNLPFDANFHCVNTIASINNDKFYI